MRVAAGRAIAPKHEPRERRAIHREGDQRAAGEWVTGDRCAGPRGAARRHREDDAVLQRDPDDVLPGIDRQVVVGVFDDPHFPVRHIDRDQHVVLRGDRKALRPLHGRAYCPRARVHPVRRVVDLGERRRGDDRDERDHDHHLDQRHGAIVSHEALPSCVDCARPRRMPRCCSSREHMGTNLGRSGLNHCHAHGPIHHYIP